MARGGGIVIQITGDAASAASALELIDQHLRETANQAKESAEGIAEAMESVKMALEGIGVLAIGEVVNESIDKLKEMIAASLEFGEAIEKAHLKTGLAVETLSTLHYAAAVTGSDFDGLTSAVTKMGKTIGAATEGDKKAQAFMKSLGLNAAELAGRSDGAEVAFRKFAATLAATENPIRRVQLATELLGKAGAQQIPLLVEVGENFDWFKDKAEAAGVMLDTKTAAALADTNKRFADLKENLAGAAVQFTEGFTPSLSKLFGVISAGSSPMEEMKTFGSMVARGMAAATAVLLEFAAAQQAANAAVSEGLFMSKTAAEQWANAKALDAKALKAGEVMMNGPGKEAPFAPEPAVASGKGGGGFTGVGDVTSAKKSTDAIAVAAAALAQANDTANAAAVKSSDDLLLAQMDADHKLFLTSDINYYREKLLLQKMSIDAEADALRDRVGELQALESKQHGDKKLTRDKDGNSAEELKTQREIVQLDQQINALEEKRAALDVTAALAATERGDAVHLASLKAAAQVEEQTNSGIAARLALLQEEQRIQMQKTTSEGGDTKTLAVLQQQQVELLKIADIERQINEAKSSNALAVGIQKDREEKDPTQSKAATKEINELDKETAKIMADLAVKYDSAAQALGGEWLEKARAVHAEIAELNTPDKKKDNAPYKTLGDGVTSMAEQIARASVSGKENFHKMTQGMEADLISLAVKFAAQKWLTPFMQNLGSGGNGGVPTPGMDMMDAFDNGHADGGDMDSPGLVGEKGPELFFPKGPGTVMPNDMISKLSGGGHAPNVAVNVINQSSQPVTARTGGVSFDADMKSFVIHTILEDHASGGPISQAAQS